MDWNGAQKWGEKTAMVMDSICVLYVSKSIYSTPHCVSYTHILLNERPPLCPIYFVKCIFYFSHFITYTIHMYPFSIPFFCIRIILLATATLTSCVACPFSSFI